jgi:perosamine synthetase
MHIRARLDLSWGGSARALAACVLPHRLARLEARLARPWEDDVPAVTCLSVRTGFDALLTALALPAGSEVLLTALTIPDLPRIVRAHGLVPVPVDIDPDTLAPDLAALRTAHSPRARVLVAAHLFGGVVDLAAARGFAASHGLLFVEDVAQSWNPGRHAGSPASDVRMFSLGPIKTGTALGGAFLLFRDVALRAQVAARLADHPVQSRWSQAQRALKFSGLQLLSVPPLFAMFRAGCRLAGRDHDSVLRDAARSFRGGELLARVRQQPSAPLLATLAWRLDTPSRSVGPRAAVGARLAHAVDAHLPLPGRAMGDPTYWLFPVLAADPEAAIARLRAAGFDATTGASSLAAVAAPPERPQALAPNAAWMAAHLLFVPCYPELPAPAIDRLATALVEEGCRRPLLRPMATQRSGTAA